MLRLLAIAAQVSLIALAAYNAITALWGWKDRPPAPVGRRRVRLRVVIPAHDEERVISHVISDLEASPYENKEVWVIADRCSDATADVAGRLGVRVAKRETGPDGKGAALSWHLAANPLGDDEALVVFDADNRVPPTALGRIADEIEAGHGAVQCYLDVVNPGSSLLAEASAMSYWAGNRMVQLARANLGWSSDLGGTGMAISSSALDKAGGFKESITEDQELGTRLVLAGERVEWLHDVRIADEKPSNLGVALRQRARWMAGKRAAARRHVGALIRTRSAAAWDQALRMVQPGRSFVALVSGILLLLALLFEADWLLPWQLWLGVVGVQLLEPIPFLMRDGITGRRLIRYPLLVLIAAMWLPVRLLSRGVEGWYHTPHGEEGTQEPTPSTGGDDANTRGSPETP